MNYASTRLKKYRFSILGVKFAYQQPPPRPPPPPPPLPSSIPSFRGKRRIRPHVPWQNKAPTHVSSYLLLVSFSSLFN
jgi:hypothetical protein